MAADTADDFQKELVDLFVQEAHEWLQNIHVALDELQQGPAPERHAKLIGIISGRSDEPWRVCCHDQSSRCHASQFRGNSLYRSSAGPTESVLCSGLSLAL